MRPLLLHIKLTAILLVFNTVSGFGQNDDTTLVYPIQPTYDPTQTETQSFDLGDPSSVEQTIVYDPETGTYVFTEKIGNGLDYRSPSMMTFDEYIEYERQKSLQENWKERIDQQTAENQPFEFPIKIDSKAFENIFGSDQITIRPQGSVELTFGVNTSRYDNPILPVKQRRVTRFDFQQQIQLNLVGQIGTRLKLGASYNTQAAFDFDNVTKLEYAGDEDQIIQKIELGQVALSLPTTLIQGSQTLFGAKTQLKFGKTTFDLIGASSKGQRNEINISGKAQVQNFELEADNYEVNKHYFVNMYFHDHYDEAMSTLPIANTTINITRIEVWLTNRTNYTENTRNIVAFSDLGEGVEDNCQGTPGTYQGEFPDNEANGLYDYASNEPLVRGFNDAVGALESQVASPGPFQQAIHYEKVENARKLTEQEFSYNAQLGFISLNQPLNNDEVLAVAYEYTYRGKTYQVGEFSTDGVAGQQALILKLLKPTIINPQNKVWDLMMKNVYSIGAYQVDQEGFRMDIYYNNPETSVNVPFFPAAGLDDIQLVTLLEMDKLNQMNQAYSDGVLDFVPIQYNGNRAENAGTINTRNGRVYFSTIEPFGGTLKKKLEDAGVPAVTVNQISYTELYDSTKTAAQQIPSKNRFSFAGQYQSSISSDIPLNALNVPEGAVTVTAGGIRLIEGQDYTVDYNLGRVKILNTGILESNTPIKISVESNSVFGFQAKSLFGTHINHRFSDKLNLGATWVRMMERPVTQKVDFGTEPYKNNVLGFDVAYNTEVPFLTKVVDLLPIISTKERSTFSFSGEFAHLIPGSPRAINKNGTSYIDDFEGAQSSIDLKSISAWRLASVPQGQPDLFPEAAKNDISAGFKRSRLAWYVIDPLFYRSDNTTPQHIKDDPSMLSDSRMRLVNQNDIFPNLQLQYGSVQNLSILDLAYYPKERGMYNYDTTNTYDANGLFNNPQDRWGGIMRALSTNNFEQTNIEYIQFWILDPFNEDAEAVNPNAQHNGGDLYINLGNISEDVLPDSRKSFENGLPADGIGTGNDTDTTDWARVSTQHVVVNAFDGETSSRINQDVGLDGFKDDAEKIHFQDFVNWVQNNPTLSAAAKAKMIADPSNDDYNYYRDDAYDSQKLNILERYKKYNGMEGNSPTNEMSDTANVDSYPNQATVAPDNEDINQDNNLAETEAYFQYKVSLKPQDMVVGRNYITNIQTFQSGNKVEKWYQFKVPIREYERKVNGITDFRSIRFMRMFLNGFDEEVVVRFAKLELIRGEWRRYFNDLTEPGDGVTPDPNLTTFNIGAVNVQENDQRSPVKYEIPPGIVREVDPSQTYQRQLNEQSLTLEVCNLADGDARAGYRNVDFDVRTYKKLKMFVHAEEVTASMPLNDEDITVFIRLGTDFTENYYEYELPLNVTAWGSTSDTEIWPEENNVEIVFDDLLNLKKERNNLIEAGTLGVNYITEYSKVDPANANRVLHIKGSPNLQDIKTIMVGVRNPKSDDHMYDSWTEDGQAKCAIVWINELRLTDFVSEGGSAAIAQMQVQLADFANVKMSGNYSGTNWGAIDSRVQERQRFTQYGFDMNANVQLGQFFGKQARVNLPFFYGYSLGVINPEYDPFNPDIKLSDYDLATRRERARAGQDFNERRSYNFTGVRKELKAGATPRFWRISNWTANYSYSEQMKRDFNINYDRTKTWNGGLMYNYSFNAKPLTPFKKVKFLNNKWFALVKEFNIYLAPKNVSFSNDVFRSYNERQIKNNLVPNYEFRPVYLKRFTWNRNYNLGWDLTKNLKFSFNATNRSMFIEQDGAVDKKLDPVLYQTFRDSVFTQLRTFGRDLDYTQSYNFTYNLPLDRIPITNWINANVKYSGTYNWQKAPIDQLEYGNVIQNSRNINMSAQANFVTLYNKVDFFKKVLSDGKQNTTRRSLDPRKSGSDGGKNVGGKGKGKGKDDEEEVDLSTMTEKEKRKYERQKKREEAEKARGGKVHPVAGFAARTIMTIRNVNGTYNLTDGTLLPGYNQGVGILGHNEQFNTSLTGFTFGQQSYDVFGRSNGYNIAELSRMNGWLVDNPDLNKQYVRTHSANLTGRATLEPLKDLTIELSLNRTYSNNSSEFYRFNDSTGAFESQSRVDIATLSYTNVSLSSAFALIGKNFESSVFDNLLETRKEVSQLLGSNNPYSSALNSGYYKGYSGTQQDVVIGAFLSTYTNRSVSDRSINPIRNIPLPNWSVNYNGLKKFEFMKEHVRNFVIRHAYSNTVSVSGMQTNLNATFDNDGNATAKDLNNNYIATMQVQNVALMERFSPLIGMDATWNIKGQGLITKFEYKKDRSSTLSLNNNQVTEVLGNEWVIGTGYRFSKVKLPFEKIDAADLNVRFDMSFRDNLTVIRKIVETTNQATAGQKVISIKFSADYNLSKYLTLQLYYDQTLNTPKIQTSYPTGNLSTGIRLRFNLAGVQ